MLGLLFAAAAGATGYVFGTKAGRERYDQIVAKTNELVGDENMAKMRSAGQTVGDKTREIFSEENREKVRFATQSAADKARQFVDDAKAKKRAQA
ncbi:hypothetical protein [Smaragdicoccus niigatensis]|uniref:hypothetical protein n=1 Tax=Smaragdicoccus niigatensis TaxID=359359 RepID=UPI000379D030|nr:hypothetical protein [Smaragdicoccus niigatensis]